MSWWRRFKTWWHGAPLPPTVLGPPGYKVVAYNRVGRSAVAEPSAPVLGPPPTYGLAIMDPGFRSRREAHSYAVYFEDMLIDCIPADSSSLTWHPVTVWKPPS